MDGDPRVGPNTVCEAPQVTAAPDAPPTNGEDSLHSRIRRLLHDGEVDLAAVRWDLRQVNSVQPTLLLRIVSELVDKGVDGPAIDYALELLAAEQATVAALCDPFQLCHSSAVVLARRLIRHEKALDLRIVHHVWRSHDHPTPGDHAVSRALDLVVALSLERRVMPVLVQMLRSASVRIRSKLVLIIGAVKRDPGWSDRFLSDPDPRTRANAVETLWGATGQEAVWLYRRAIRDPNHRVVANAYVGLFLAGQQNEARTGLLGMSVEGTPEFQAAAAWAMGHCCDPHFRQRLEQMASSDKPAVRRSAIRAIVRIRKPDHPSAP